MKSHKKISLLLLLIAITMSVAFFLKIDFPQGFDLYFKTEQLL